MKRLRSAMWLDIRLQWRNRLYHVTAFVAVLTILIMRALLEPSILPQALPVYFLGTQALAYFYVGAMVLFEKSENSLQGTIVSPLRSSEYLASKVITVTLLVALEALIVTVGTYGIGFQPVWFAIGAFGMGGLFAAVGLAVVVRYEDMPTFIMPSILVITVMSLPFIHYFKLWENPVMYATPSYPAFMLLAASFEPHSAGRIAYGIAGCAIVVGIAYAWSRRAFQRHMIEGQGAA